MVRNIFIGLFLLVLASPIAAQATPYQWEIGCFNAVEKCWATNFDPNAGYLGSQPRDDDLNSLPTFNASGLWYGSPNLNSSHCSPMPPTGGDYPWGGGDSCGEACEPGVSCNITPSSFVTQNYTDGNGAWHFAMGGANQCVSNGKQVPCNIGHRMFPYDCAYPGYSSNCVYTSPQDMPFTWGFPSTMYFQMTSNLYVGGASGAWHAFLCADVIDGVTGEKLEMCDEPWHSEAAHEGTRVACEKQINSATLWQKAGIASNYMTTYGQSTRSLGTTIKENWTMTRGQFINLVAAVANQCGLSNDTAMDNWKLYYSENGIESYGPSGYGTGVNFQVWEETMVTNY